jgi:hypothetical protein
MSVKRSSRKITIAIGDVGDAMPLPAHFKKHIFQVSTAMTITPVLLSGSDGTGQAMVAGETWETAAPLSGFKSSAIGDVFWAGDID